MKLCIDWVHSVTRLVAVKVDQFLNLWDWLHQFLALNEHTKCGQLLTVQLLTSIAKYYSKFYKDSLFLFAGYSVNLMPKILLQICSITITLYT